MFLLPWNLVNALRFFTISSGAAVIYHRFTTKYSGFTILFCTEGSIYYSPGGSTENISDRFSADDNGDMDGDDNVFRDAVEVTPLIVEIIENDSIMPDIKTEIIDEYFESAEESYVNSLKRKSPIQNLEDQKKLF